ncbi:hypothetical protein AJ79_10134 [Helicocarpus griseus UAMH5409]|uniref:Uncharacterized protein n=1 Tax=Helicocarpus griseus UAMH5409 TaxID=1447875 RepID=A0A2B7WFH3_9EURO|nr:hypothetical protein AJ79_10134 [Helicocarpus griseus UAMH5409]
MADQALEPELLTSTEKGTVTNNSDNRVEENDENEEQQSSQEQKANYEEEDEEAEEGFGELASHRESTYISDIDGVITFDRDPTCITTWTAGPIFHERSMMDYHIPEASALCVATQVNGPEPGKKALLRIRLQIPT